MTFKLSPATAALKKRHTELHKALIELYDESDWERRYIRLAQYLSSAESLHAAYRADAEAHVAVLEKRLEDMTPPHEDYERRVAEKEAAENYIIELQGEVDSLANQLHHAKEERDKYAGEWRRHEETIETQRRQIVEKNERIELLTERLDDAQRAWQDADEGRAMSEMSEGLEHDRCAELEAERDELRAKAGAWDEMVEYREGNQVSGPHELPKKYATFFGQTYQIAKRRGLLDEDGYLRRPSADVQHDI